MVDSGTGHDFNSEESRWMEEHHVEYGQRPLFSQVIIHDRFVSIHLFVVITLRDA